MKVLLDYLRETVVLTVGGALLAAGFALIAFFAPLIALFTIDK